MIVKRYLVKDMPEALNRIKQDLGHEAVILSSKKVKQRGVFGMFGATQLEVVAAVNDGPPTAVKTPVSAAAKAYGQNKTSVGKQQAVPTKQTSSAGRQPSAVQRASLPADTQYDAKQVAGLMAAVERQISLQRQTAETRGGEFEAEILKEVQGLRDVISKFLHTGSDILPAPIQKIRSDLERNDLSDELIESLVLRILKENEQIHSLDEQEFRHILINLISKEINDHMLPAPLASTSKVVAFVGPTGVGKTTTIAKIAAAEFLKNRRKVGFITADTFRIAAVEQLKTYGNILQMPVEVVFSSDEIEQAIEKMKDLDLILIDTAGRNYGDTAYVSQLNDFLGACKPDETFLVLSLTTKSNDLEQIVSNFEGVPIDKFIFTKLDETTSYGAIFNLSYRFKKPSAYFTTGQNVPDDIEVATPEKIASLIVGENHNV